MSATALDSAQAAGAPGSTLAPTRRRLPLRRLLLGAAVLGVVAAGSAYGHHWWTVGRFLSSTDDAYVGGDVTVMAPRVAGLITQVLVRDNQSVHAGDLLVVIDDRQYRAALARASANVAAQQAALGNLAAARHLQEAVLAGAQADVAAADADLARTRLDYTRYRALSTDQYASTQRFEQADADQKKAAASLARTGAAVIAASRQLDVIDTQRKQVEAALDVAGAERDLAALDLGYTELRAPFDGVIGNRSARVGGYAMVGAALVSLVPSSGLWVDANFKESQLAGMHPGQAATVEADVLPGEIFAGHVESLAPATGAEFSVLPPENATGNFTKIVQRVPVRIRLDGDAGLLGRLRPGLSVTAQVDLRGAPARPPR